MNQYGALAQQHCKRWRPASYAAITDPAAYFTDLGEQAAGEITRLWAQMRDQAGNPSGEEYLARVARLNALRKQAEEIVLAELILLPPGPGPAPGCPGRRQAGQDRKLLESMLPGRPARLYACGVDTAEAPGRDGTRVVELPAAIDQDSADQVHAALTGALAAGVTVLVADMTATTYCTLEGVRALLRVHRAAQAAGARLRLAAVAPAVQRILEMTGTSKLLSTDPGLDAAPDGQAAPAPG